MMIRNIMTLLYNDNKCYTGHVYFLLPLIMFNKKYKTDFDKCELKCTKLTFETTFDLTYKDNSFNILIAVLGFGIGLSMQTKDDYES